MLLVIIDPNTKFSNFPHFWAETHNFRLCQTFTQNADTPLEPQALKTPEVVFEFQLKI